MTKGYEKYIRDSSWTSDIWTGLGQNKFLGLTGHFYDDEWFLRRTVLDLLYFPERHTGVNITSEFLTESVKWGAKPFQVVTDCGAL